MTILTYFLCRCFGAPARRVFPDHLITSISPRAPPPGYPSPASRAPLRRGHSNAACSLQAGATSEDAAGTCNTTHTECVPCVAV